MADSNINAKLMKALQAMANPVKDTKGHNYKYAQLDQVMEIVKPALYANGLAIKQGIGPDYSDGKPLLITEVFDETATLALDRRPIKIMDDPQKQGSYETYMRRYALLTVFGLAPEDDDGQAAKPQQKPRAKAKAPDNDGQAKGRLWKAMTDYCRRNGVDHNAEIEELGGSEFIGRQSADWLNARADYYEAN